MWVFLNNAMLSIVANKDSPGMLLVRARLRGDIERLFPHHRVEETNHADYRFRTSSRREHVANVLWGCVESIGYPNFKNSVKDLGRHDTYTRVWSVMARAQEAEMESEGVRSSNYYPFENGYSRPREPLAWPRSLVDGANRATEGPTLRFYTGHPDDPVPASHPRVAAAVSALQKKRKAKRKAKAVPKKKARR